MSGEPMTNIATPLPAGSAVDAYRIEAPHSSGGFSIVYRGVDADGAPVAIKEYFPGRLAARAADGALEVATDCRGAFNAGLNAFFAEARVLAEIDHPNVVRVLNIFRANNTAYMVMRREEGRTLHERLRLLAANGEPVREQFLRNVFAHLLAGLREVHRRRLLHLDIKPANILLRGNGQPLLLDFGATRHGLGAEATRLVPVLTPGYAAPEQHQDGQPLGPWTDIYSIGATLYDCLAGGPPPAADLRLSGEPMVPASNRFADRYSAQFLEIIDWCLRLPSDQRPQSVHAVQKVLSGELLDLVDPAWFDSAD
jgi:serine/threonine protein kinase